MKLPGLVIKDFSLKICIVQGGMGAAVSLYPLVGAVSREGGLGTLSSVGLRSVVSLRDGKEVDTYTAVRIEIEKAKECSNGGPIAINVMCALVGDYDDIVRASIDAGVDAIVSGAGLPSRLPGIKKPGHTALIPIVSSARALKIIIGRWEHFSYKPDAVVLEGPLAGGHLGFKVDEIENPGFTLEKLLPPVLDLVSKHGNFPVIVAGGIYTHKDIVKFLKMGASGVQLGTRFLVAEESSAPNLYKQKVISAKKEDIIVVAYPDEIPASPCRLPFRILKTSPMYTAKRQAKCDKKYVMQRGSDGKLSSCLAMPKNPNSQSFLCICNGLLASAGYEPNEPELYTVGTNAYRIKKIVSAEEIMLELRGVFILFRWYKRLKNFLHKKILSTVAVICE